MTVKPAFRSTLLCALLLAALPASAAESWAPVYRTVTYPVDGGSGIALYESIGHRGPVIGKGKIRAIAHTGFRLTWTRKYEVIDGACVLTVAVPKLVITTTLPKARQKLDGPVAENFNRFVAGIAAHERQHGVLIETMTRKIEAATRGLSIANDPGCVKIRQEMTRRLGALSNEQQQLSNAFDATEMAPGGTIEKLVLALVNGG